MSIGGWAPDEIRISAAAYSGKGLQFAHPYNPHVAAMQLYQALILKPAQQLGQPSYGSIIPDDGLVR
jgi:hypothetical protein